MVLNIVLMGISRLVMNCRYALSAFVGVFTLRYFFHNHCDRTHFALTSNIYEPIVPYV
jgi:hypothetical protein